MSVTPIAATGNSGFSTAPNPTPISFSVNVPTHIEGDLILALITRINSSGQNPTASQGGWTAAPSETWRVLYRFATSSEPSSYGFEMERSFGASSSLRVTLVTFRGVDTVTPLLGRISGSGSGTSRSIGTLTGITSGDRIIARFQTNQSTTSLGTQSGWNSIFLLNVSTSPQHRHGSFHHTSPSSSEAVAPTASVSASWEGVAFIVSQVIPRPPNTPSGLSLSTNDHQGISASWSATDDTDTYEFQYSLSSSFTSPTTVTGIVTTSTTVNSLSSGTIYWGRVRACNVNGCSDWSTSDSTMTFSPEFVEGDVIRTVYSLDTYDADTLRESFQYSVFTADSERGSLRMDGLSVDTFRLVIFENIFTADTARNIFSPIVYSTDSIRVLHQFHESPFDMKRVIAHDELFTADTFRLVGFHGFHEADVLRTIYRIDLLDADTQRRVGGPDLFIGDAIRVIAISTLYEADTFRSLYQINNYPSDSIREIHKMFSYIADTDRLLVPGEPKFPIRATIRPGSVTSSIRNVNKPYAIIDEGD